MSQDIKKMLQIILFIMLNVLVNKSYAFEMEVGLNKMVIVNHNHDENIKNIKESLKNILTEEELVEIRPIENSGLYMVNIGDKKLISDKNGEYIIRGTIVKNEDGNFNKVVMDKKRFLNLSFLDFFDEGDFINYISKNEEKIVYVFFDYSCPYCIKLHNETRGELLKSGITVKYIPYSRSRNNKKIVNNLISIFCIKDQEKKKRELNEVIKNPKGYKIKEDCNRSALLKDSINLGHYMGIEGSPAIFSKSGKYIGAYDRNFIKLINRIKSSK